MEVLTITDPYEGAEYSNLCLGPTVKDVNLTIMQFDTKASDFESKVLAVDKVALIICDYILQNSIELVAIPSTPYLKMLAPRIAIHLNTGIVADINAVQIESDQLVMIRPIQSETKLAAIACNCTPYVYTYRQILGDDEKIRYKSITHRIIKLNFEVKLKVKYKDQDLKYDISKYKVVVCAGYGFGDNFKKLINLSKNLNIGLAATKKAVDAGYADHKYQIGLSSKKIAPDVYIGLGVEGAIQHAVGMEKSKMIVSVNKSEHAALNSIADIVIYEDANKFIDLLLKQDKS